MVTLSCSQDTTHIIKFRFQLKYTAVKKLDERYIIPLVFVNLLDCLSKSLFPESQGHGGSHQDSMTSKNGVCCYLYIESRVFITCFSVHTS